MVASLEGLTLVDRARKSLAASCNSMARLSVTKQSDNQANNHCGYMAG